MFGRLDETAHFFPSQHALKKNCSVTIEKTLANRFRLLGYGSSRLRRHARAHSDGPTRLPDVGRSHLLEVGSGKWKPRDEMENERLPSLNLSDVCRSSTRIPLSFSRRDETLDDVSISPLSSSLRNGWSPPTKEATE